MVDRDIKFYRAATYLTVFNIVLMWYRAVDGDFDRLTTVGAADVLMSKQFHTLHTLLLRPLLATVPAQFK